MALGGFFLGGIAQGMEDQQKLGLEQQKTDQSYELGLKGLQIQEQAQKNAEHRDLLNRADKARSELWGIVSQTIQHAKATGADNATISQSVQPLIQPLKRLTQSSGLDASTIDAQLATLLAQSGLDLAIVTPGAGNRATPTAPAAAPGPAAPTAAGGGSPYMGGSAANGGMPNLTSGYVSGLPGDQQSTPAVNQTDPRYAQGVSMLREGMSPAAAAPAAPAAPAPDPQEEVNRLTRAIITLPPGAENARAALTVRLQDALKRANQASPNLEFKTVQGPDFSQTPVTFNPRTGEVKPVQGLPEATGESSADAIAQGIKDGTQPPVTTGLYRQGPAVRGILAKDKFDLAKAQLEWDRAHRQIASLNGPQMIKYQGLAESVVATIDEVRELAHQMGNSGVPLANRAKIQAYIQAEGNSEKGQLATRYLTAVNTLKEEFTNLAQGGYAPTESAWALANSQINADYGYKQMEASLTEVRRLIQYRLQAIPNMQTLGPGGANRYGGGGAAAQPGLSGQTSGGISWSAQ